MFGFGYLLKNCESYSKFASAERRRGGQPNVDQCGERCGGSKIIENVWTSFMDAPPSPHRPPPNDLKYKWKQQDSNHLVCQRTLNHLAKLAKWSSCGASTSLYGVFDCMLSSCYVRVLEWIHTLTLPECQGPQIWPNDCAALRVLIYTVNLTVCYYVTFAF